MSVTQKRVGWYERGDRLADRFEVESLLGSGGMGNVYLARHVVLQRKFAVKVLSGDATSEQAVTRFRKEARAASRVHHRNVTAVVDFGHTEEGCPYLVMEYAEGPTLAETLDSAGQLPVRRALGILRQVADALSAAHASGVIHRDLKAQNIVLTSDYDQHEVVKVLDFGLAEILKENPSPAPADGEVAGTPAYMAPEQCRGEPTDARTDIYAFGVLAFEMLVGRPPFRGTLIEQVAAHIRTTPPKVSEAAERQDIPQEVDALVARCLAKKAADRYPSAAVLSQHLRLLLRAAAAALLDAAAEHPEGGADDTSMRTGISGPWDATTAGGSLDWATPDWSDATGWTRTEAEWTRTDFEPAEARYLEDLAFAVRDHGLGSAAISYALASKLRAEDDAFRLLGDIHLLETHLEGLEAASRERELRLRQAMSQLEHERAVARKSGGAPPDAGPTLQLDRAIGEIAGHVERIQERVQRQRKQLRRQLARLARRLAAVQVRVAVQQGNLAKILKDLGETALKQVLPAAPIEVLDKLAARSEERDTGPGGAPADDARALEQALHLLGLGAEPAATGPGHLKREAKKVDPATTLIRLAGAIDERSDFVQLASEIPTGAVNVVIDTSEVQRVNSPGVREWIAWLQGLRSRGHRCYFLECSPAIMAKVSEVEGFLANGQIVSFWAPYFCPSCEAENVLLIGIEAAKAASFEVPVCYCERCDHTLMEFDDIESSYFAFLEQCQPPRLDATLAATLKKLSRSATGALIPTAKLAARDAVSGEVQRPDAAEPPAAPQPPRRKSRLKIGVEQRKGAIALVTLSGVVDEYNELSLVSEQIPQGTRSVLIDTADVQRINSCGVRDWISLLGEFDKQGYVYYFLDCTPALMTQVSLVPGFLVHGEILTFFAPYFCSSCEMDKMLRISVEQALADEGFKAPDCRCDECKNPMEFDDIESTYFAFLQGKQRPQLDAALAATLAKHCPPSAEGLKPIPTIEPSAPEPPPAGGPLPRPPTDEVTVALADPSSAAQEDPWTEPEPTSPGLSRHARSARALKILCAVFGMFIVALLLLIYVMTR